MLSEISQRKTKIIWFHSYEDVKRQKKMNIREGIQKQYKNKEGDKTEEIHKYGEQAEGCWRGCGRGNGLNG